MKTQKVLLNIFDGDIGYFQFRLPKVFDSPRIFKMQIKHIQNLPKFDFFSTPAPYHDSKTFANDGAFFIQIVPQLSLEVRGLSKLHDTKTHCRAWSMRQLRWLRRNSLHAAGNIQSGQREALPVPDGQQRLPQLPLRNFGAGTHIAHDCLRWSAI